MAKVSVNSSQNKCCHLKCGNQACKGKERNVTCNPSGSVNKLGSCFRFLSDKTTYLTVSKVISSCWNSGKSREGSFAILQLLFKLLVESLFQFLELSHFICLAQEHAQSGSALRSRHRVGEQSWSYRRSSLCVEIQWPPLISRCFCEFFLGDRITFLTKAHPADPRGKSQALSSALLCRWSLTEWPYTTCVLQGEGFRYDQHLSNVWRLSTGLQY